MVMQRKRNIKLGRVLRPSHESPNRITIYCFDLDVTVQDEDGKTVAFDAPIEGCVAGVGSNDEEAINDFVDGFKELIDFQIERGVLDRFLNENYGGFKTVRMEADEEDHDAYASITPAWQIPTRDPYHAA